MPHTRARPTRDGTVVTVVACPSVTCEALGQPVGDEARNDDAAIALWNRLGGRKVA